MAVITGGYYKLSLPNRDFFNNQKQYFIGKKMSHYVGLVLY